MPPVLLARRRLLAVGAIAAPVLAAIGASLNPDAGDDPVAIVAQVHANETATLVGSILMTVGAVLFLATFAAFAALTPRRGGTLTTIGMIVGGFGAAIFGGALLFEGTTELALSRDVAVTVTRQLNDAFLGNLPWMAVYLLALGSLISTIGLLVARATPIWVGLLLIVGFFLTWFAGNFGQVSQLLWLPFTIGVAFAVRPLLAATTPDPAARPAAAVARPEAPVEA